MVKFVFSKDMFYHVTPADLASLSWLSVQDRVRFFKLNLVFKIRIGKAPGYLSPNFVPFCHSHNTRRSPFDYLVSKEQANSPHSFSYTAIKLWNDLPPRLKKLDSLPIFKKRLKEHLFSFY